MALCHNEQTAALLLNFGLGHVLQYTPFILHFSALHFTHSYTIQEGVPKFFDTPSFNLKLLILNVYFSLILLLIIRS